MILYDYAHPGFPRQVVAMDLWARHTGVYSHTLSPYSNDISAHFVPLSLVQHVCPIHSGPLRLKLRFRLGGLG